MTVDDVAPRQQPVAPTPARLAWLEARIERCPTCGEFRGTITREDVAPHDPRRLLVVTCICSGRVCGSCGVHRKHRTGSNYVDTDGVIVHVPWFGYMTPCDRCHAVLSGPAGLGARLRSLTAEELAQVRRDLTDRRTDTDGSAG